jgi:cysteine-rich repeat protein
MRTTSPNAAHRAAARWSEGLSRWSVPLLHVALALSAASCGGGTTGHEGLDVKTPPPGSPTTPPTDSALPDASFGNDVIEAADTSVASDAGGKVDIAVQMDSTTADVSVATDDVQDSRLADTMRVREGAVIRDTPLVDPNDASGDARDAALDLPPPTVCGDGKKEGREQCDDGNSLSGDGCSAICTDTRACDACLALNCADAFDPPVWPLCTGVKGNAQNGEGVGRPRKDLCQEVYACALRADCVDWKSSDVTPCYCGTATTEDCLSSIDKAKGPCKAEIVNGVESEMPTFIATQMTATNNAAGAALMVRRCAVDLCPVECAPNANGDGGTSDAGSTADAPGGG